MEASKLSLILDQHKLWLETNEVQGERADLRFAKLNGASLHSANLRCANLNGADLTGADLWCANLTGANLTRANLRDANLRDAYLWDADLWDADLTGANLTGANLARANLLGTNLGGANLGGANLRYAKLTGATGLPDISWIIPGCLVQLNHINYKFYLKKEDKYEDFVQDSFGFIVQKNSEEGTFDMLVEDWIIRNIPHWVKYSGLKQIASESD